MRLTSLGLCLVVLVLASPAVASPIGIDVVITSGQTDRPVTPTTGAVLTLFGDDFSLSARLFEGFFAARPPFLPGATITIHAGWSGLDAPGSFTYLGQSTTFGGFNGPSLRVDFLSDPFVVPPLDGTNSLLIPFAFTGTISPLADNAELDLHGTGTMAFTFSDPTTTPPPAVWLGGSALFTFEAPVPTPEPAPFIFLGVALVGLVIYTR